MVLAEAEFQQVYHTAFITERDPDELPSQEKNARAKDAAAESQESFIFPVMGDGMNGVSELRHILSSVSAQHDFCLCLATEWGHDSQEAG